MPTSPRLRRVASIPVGAAVIVFAACSAPEEPSRQPVRLVDLFASSVVESSPPPAPAGYEATSWTFADGANDFRAERGIEGLEVVEGVLRGSVTGEEAFVVARRPTDVPDGERVHSVEVRAKVSDGDHLTVRFDGDPLVLGRALGNPFGEFRTPLRTGEEMQTYVLRPPRTVTADSAHHLLISPSDTAGARFEIESVKLVFEGEHFASIPSGVSWKGMSEIYRESIVARAPETLRYQAVLPAAPALEVAVGSTGATAVDFRVEVIPESGEPRVIEQSITEPEAWSELWLELDGLDGAAVEIALSLSGDEGTIGVWGNPVVRSRTAPDELAGVILILTDTLRADHLASYGYERETAPTLTRLADEGVRFANTVSQATWTKVSVPAIQTSLYPSTHTVADIPDRLPAAAQTLAEVYREAGYATLALTTIPFVGRLTALHQGYEVMHEGASVDDDLGPKTAREHVGRLLPWIEQRHDTPFFALLHVADPHSPYRPLPEDEEIFSEPGDMDRLDGWIEQVRPHITHHELMQRFGMPLREELEAAGLDPESFVAHELDGYDSSIRGMDVALEQLFSRLDELELGGRVLVAVVADHGTEFLEHDAHFHGHTVYGELNRVPMLLWQPGRLPAGVVVEPTVQTIDLMPTMLELSGLPVPERAQGASLAPLFDGTEAPLWNRPAITEMLMTLRGHTSTAIQLGEWKLIRHEVDDGDVRHALYRHLDDPLNQIDVAAEHPEVVERLSSVLDNWRRQAEAARLDRVDPTAGMDAAELERLRSLGYI